MFLCISIMVRRSWSDVSLFFCARSPTTARSVRNCCFAFPPGFPDMLETLGAVVEGRGGGGGDGMWSEEVDDTGVTGRGKLRCGCVVRSQCLIICSMRLTLNSQLTLWVVASCELGCWCGRCRDGNTGGRGRHHRGDCGEVWMFSPLHRPLPRPNNRNHPTRLPRHLDPVRLSRRRGSSRRKPRRQRL